MLQHDKLQKLIHRDVDGRESRRPGGGGSSGLRLHDDPQPSGAPHPERRRSISAFGGGEESRMAHMAAMANMRRPATLNQAQSAALTAAAAAAAAAAATRSRSQQRSSSTDPDDVMDGPASSAAGSLSSAADSTAAPSALSSGRLKVRPTVRSWKHTKATAQEDSLSNLALLAKRYSDAAGAAKAAGAAGGNIASSGVLLGDMRSRRTELGVDRGSATTSNRTSSNDVSDHDVSDVAGGHSDDDASANGDELSELGKTKRSTVGRLKANLQRKGTNITRKFRDIANNFTSNKKPHPLSGAVRSGASASSLLDEKEGDADVDAAADELSTASALGADHPSGSVGGSGVGKDTSLLMLNSPSPLSSLSDLATEDSNRLALQRSPSPMAHLREHDKQLAQTASLAKDSAHWKPRTSTQEKDSNGKREGDEQLRLQLNGQHVDSFSRPAPLSSSLILQAGAANGNNGNGLGGPAQSPASAQSSLPSPTTSPDGEPPPLLRALTSPQRAAGIAAAFSTPSASASPTGSGSSSGLPFGAVPSGGLISPSRRATLGTLEGNTPLFLRKFSSAAADSQLGRRDTVGSRDEGELGSRYRDRSTSSASTNLAHSSLPQLNSPLGSPDGNGGMSKDVSTLRALLHQHATDVELQIADIESALSSADIGSMKARIEAIEEAQRMRRAEVDARLARVDAELHSVKEMQRLTIKQLYAEMQKLGGVAPLPRRSQGFGETLSNMGFVLVKWFGLGIATMSEPLGAIYPYVAQIACCRRLARKAAVASTNAMRAEYEHTLATGGTTSSGGFGGAPPTTSSMAAAGLSSANSQTLAPHSHTDRYASSGGVGGSSSASSQRLGKAEQTLSKSAQSALRSSGFDPYGNAGGGTNTSSRMSGGSSGSMPVMSSRDNSSRSSSSVLPLPQRRLHSRPNSAIMHQRDLNGLPDNDDEYGSAASAAASAAAAAASAAASGALTDSDDEGMEEDSRFASVLPPPSQYDADVDGDAFSERRVGGMHLPSDSERSTASDRHSRGGAQADEDAHSRSRGVPLTHRSTTFSRQGGGTAAAASSRSRPLSAQAQARSTMAQLRNASKALAPTKRA